MNDKGQGRLTVVIIINSCRSCCLICGFVTGKGGVKWEEIHPAVQKQEDEKCACQTRQETGAMHIHAIGGRAISILSVRAIKKIKTSIISKILKKTGDYVTSCTTA